MSDTIKVTNPSRRRKWGWGYSASVVDTPGGWEIHKPTKPDYTGTLNQVQDAREKDRTFKSFRSGGTYYSEIWFYDGKQVLNMPEVMEEFDLADILGKPLTSVTLVVK